MNNFLNFISQKSDIAIGILLGPIYFGILFLARVIKTWREEEMDSLIEEEIYLKRAVKTFKARREDLELFMGKKDSMDDFLMRVNKRSEKRRREMEGKI